MLSPSFLVVVLGRKRPVTPTFLLSFFFLNIIILSLAVFTVLWLTFYVHFLSAILVVALFVISVFDFLIFFLFSGT